MFLELAFQNRFFRLKRHNFRTWIPDRNAKGLAIPPAVYVWTCLILPGSVQPFVSFLIQASLSLHWGHSNQFQQQNLLPFAYKEKE
jgi:hypothetical protein